MFGRRFIELERKKAHRRVKNSLIMSCLMLSLGFFLGVHRSVIKAYLKGEELPESPHSHCRW